MIGSSTLLQLSPFQFQISNHTLKLLYLFVFRIYTDRLPPIRGVEPKRRSSYLKNRKMLLTLYRNVESNLSKKRRKISFAILEPYILKKTKRTFTITETKGCGPCAWLADYWLPTASRNPTLRRPLNRPS